jgi:GT2 family glycosyltransferase
MPTAIIPNWNGERMLGPLLEDLAAQTTRFSRVLVVDNGSTDESVALARSRGADVIQVERNRGFAYAVNRGIEACGTALVAILNNDVRLAPDWVEILCTALETDPAASFASGKIYSLREENQRAATLDGAFDALCRGACSWRCGHRRPDGEAWNRPQRIQMAPFTALVLRRMLFEKVGVLDESFESYLEDVDFGTRCALDGKYGVYVPHAEAWHWGSATLGPWHAETVRRISRNQVYLVAKHYPKTWIYRYGWPVLVAQLLYGLLAMRRRAARAWLRGKWEGIREFRRRRNGNVRPETFEAMVQSSERTLYELQRQTGFDWYWRVYFTLAGRG